MSKKALITGITGQEILFAFIQSRAHAREYAIHACMKTHISEHV